MNRTFLSLVLLNTLCLSAPTLADSKLAAELSVKYQLLAPSYAQCPTSKLRKEPGCYLSRLSLTLPYATSDKNWKIYFSQLTPVIEATHPQLQIRHLNGDLHELSPKAGFQGFVAHQAIAIDFISASSIFSQSMLPGNYLLQDAEGQVHTIASTDTAKVDASGTPAFIQPFTANQANFLQNPADQLGVASGESLYQHYAKVHAKQATHGAIDTRLIPKPAFLQSLSPQAVSTKAGFTLQLADPSLKTELAAGLQLLTNQQLLNPNSAKPLQIKVQAGLKSAEHYRLQITATGIEISAGGVAGAYYALQSLAQLAEMQPQQLPAVLIEDGPTFAYRGQHVDLARNFLGKDFVMQLISQMGRYKMNQLHLHLADDEGWRIAINSLPELTELASRRCLDLTEQRCLLPQLGAGHQPDALPNGYLSQQDYLDILRHAKAHHIRVIPSLDMPGHSRAAVKAMALRAEKLKQQQDANWDQYLLTEAADRSDYLSIQYYHDNTLNVCLDSSYRFIGTVLDELVSMHQQAGMPLKLYHIGADETAGAWLQSPACQQLRQAGEQDLMAYFLRRTAQILADKGVQLAAWSDGLKHLQPGTPQAPQLPTTVTSYIWQNSYDGAALTAHQHANSGWQVVLALPDASYFDVPYLNTPYARGNHWASRQLDTEKVFQFLPQNLPALAAIWRDVNGKGYRIDDKTVLTSPQNIIGLQGNLWTEVMPDAASAWPMLLPRLLAFAERSWHRADWQVSYQAGKAYSQETALWSQTQKAAYQADWQSFSARLWQHEVPTLLKAGLPVQLPWVGVSKIDGKLHALTEPGLAIEFQQGQGPWLRYQQPVPAQQSTRFRSLVIDQNITASPKENAAALAHGLSSTNTTTW
jgi:hexosaminidase